MQPAHIKLKTHIKENGKLEIEDACLRRGLEFVNARNKSVELCLLSTSRSAYDGFLQLCERNSLGYFVSSLVQAQCVIDEIKKEQPLYLEANVKVIECLSDKSVDKDRKRDLYDVINESMGLLEEELDMLEIADRLDRKDVFTKDEIWNAVSNSSRSRRQLTQSLLKLLVTKDEETIKLFLDVLVETNKDYLLQTMNEDSMILGNARLVRQNLVAHYVQLVDEICKDIRDFQPAFSVRNHPHLTDTFFQELLWRYPTDPNRQAMAFIQAVLKSDDYALCGLLSALKEIPHHDVHLSKLLQGPCDDKTSQSMTTDHSEKFFSFKWMLRKDDQKVLLIEETTGKAEQVRQPSLVSLPQAIGKTVVETDIQSVLADIVEHARHRPNSENVLLVGLAGSGKSSLINTIRKPLTVRYVQVARGGHGSSTQTITRHLAWYHRLSLSEEQIADNRRPIRDVLSKLPNIVDFSALKDEDTNDLQELLFLVLNGSIPPGTDIKTLTGLQEKGNNYLTRAYAGKEDEKRKISAVLFVHSGLVEAPKALISRLKEAIAQVQHDVRVYVVLTKYDKVTKENDVTKFDTNKAFFADAFSLRGVEEYYIIRWRNYCTDLGFDDPKIDLSSLELLRMIMSHILNVPPPPIPTPPIPRPTAQQIPKSPDGNDRLAGVVCLLFVLIAIVIALVMRA